MSRFVIFQGADAQWFWRLVSTNGKTVAASEGYVRRNGAIAGARAMQRTAARARLEIQAPTWVK